MVTLLTNEHYKTIINFSRKITKGDKADDLSQHVILKILQKDTQFVNGLINRGNEFDRFMWRFIDRMYKHTGSSFNRIENETSDPKQIKSKVDLDGVMFLLQLHTDEGDYYIDDNFLQYGAFNVSHTDRDYFINTKSCNYDAKTDLKSIIKRAGLTDIERMYLNAYIDNGMSYQKCSIELDIHHQTISRHVNKAIDKCKNSL